MSAAPPARAALATVVATRYVTPLREGGSLPGLMEADDDGLYVVKFRGAGQGAKALIAELLAAELAGELGLPLPAHAIVEIDAGFGQGEPDPEIQDILRGSTGLNFGLAFLPGAIGFDAAVDRAVGAELAAAIVWFDAYITNIDRTARNTNMLFHQGRLYLIDHGAALYFQHRWEGWRERIHGRFPPIRDHVLLPLAGDIAAADARLAPLLGQGDIQRAVAALPDEWLAGEPNFPDPAAQRAAWAEFFLARLRGPGDPGDAPVPRPFVQEASDAAARLGLV